MYIICPVCNVDSWIPMGRGLRVQYSNGDVIVPNFKLNKRKIHWNCSCLAKNKLKSIEETAEGTIEETAEGTIEETNKYWIKDLLKEFEFGKRGNLEVVKLIVEHGPEAVDPYGWSVVHFAVNTGNITALDMLLKHNVKINVQAEAHLLTPLHMAISKGYDMVNVLLKSGANVDMVTDGGHTPLHMAAEDMKLDIIELLIKNGSNKNALDIHGRTPLDLFKISLPLHKIDIKSCNLDSFKEYSQHIENLLS